MSDHTKSSKFLVAILVGLSLLLFICWKKSEKNMAYRAGFSPGRGITWGGAAEGFSPGRGITWGGAEGFVLNPINSYESTPVNRSLNDLETSDTMLGRSRDCKSEKCVSSKWMAQAPIHLNANYKKQEGMADGDETQYSRDHNNIGSDIDSTLNDLMTQDPGLKLSCGDGCPSVSGMNRKWTDTAMDDISPLYGGYGAYAPTYARINMG